MDSIHFHEEFLKLTDYLTSIGNYKFDKNGKLASNGKVDNASHKSMIKHSFFRKRYPKTTGKELFNYDFIPKRLLAKNPSDCVATLNEFSALMISKEINKLIGKIQREGLTIVPTKMYFKKGKAKIEIAVAKGKKQYDKRYSKKTKDWNREKARYFRKSS